MTLDLRRPIKVEETLMPVGIYPNMPACAVNAIIDKVGTAEFWLNVVVTPDPVENWGPQAA
jgi:hypothetical protein